MAAKPKFESERQTIGNYSSFLQLAGNVPGDKLNPSRVDRELPSTPHFKRGYSYSIPSGLNTRANPSGFSYTEASKSLGSNARKATNPERDCIRAAQQIPDHEYNSQQIPEGLNMLSPRCLTWGEGPNQINPGGV